MKTVLDSSLIMDEVRSWIGTPYRHQASAKGVGCDCLGLLRGIWRHLYGTEPQAVPPYSADWDLVEKRDDLLIAARNLLVPVNKVQPAAVVLFRWQPHLPAKHLAIAGGPDRIIHAYERVGVVETALGSHWRSRIAGIFGFPGFETPSKSEKE